MKWEIKVVATNGRGTAEAEGSGWVIVGASQQTDLHRTQRWVQLVLAREIIDPEPEL